MSLCKWKETVFCFTITHCDVSREKLPPTPRQMLSNATKVLLLSVSSHHPGSMGPPRARCRTGRCGPGLTAAFHRPPLLDHPPNPLPASSSTEQMLLTFATHAHTPPLCAGAPELSGGHVVNKAGFVTLCVQARAVGTLATAHTARAGEC